MADATDQAFYDRADAHIELSNEQPKTFENLGQVSASMIFGTNRFNARALVRPFNSAAHNASDPEPMLKYLYVHSRMWRAHTL